MNILVTGSTGFLGRHLCLELKKQGHTVWECHSKNCDLTLSSSLAQFDQQQFDLIYHLAAWTQAGDFCLKYPADQWLINQKINTHLLNFWQKSQSKATLICIGTSCAYDPTLPLKEENYLAGKPIESLFTYAMTKRMLLSGLLAMHQQYGLNYLYLIPSTLYGPHYHTDKRQLHFIFDLIAKILRGKHKKEKVVLWGDGKQKRELVHVDDFVRAMLILNEIKLKNIVLNIGSGREYSIEEFAKLISTYVGYPFEAIEFDREKYVGARSKVLDVRKMSAVLPHFSKTPLEWGLPETIEWFEKQIL